MNLKNIQFINEKDREIIETHDFVIDLNSDPEYSDYICKICSIILLQEFQGSKIYSLVGKNGTCNEILIQNIIM